MQIIQRKLMDGSDVSITDDEEEDPFESIPSSTHSIAAGSDKQMKPPEEFSPANRLADIIGPILKMAEERGVRVASSRDSKVLPRPPTLPRMSKSSQGSRSNTMSKVKQAE